MNNTIKYFMIIIGVFLLVGLGTLSATDLAKSDTSLTNSADTVKANIINKDTKNVDKTLDTSLNFNQKENRINGKTIKKSNSTDKVKTASKTYSVTNFNQLNSYLTSNSYDTVTLNINSNINLLGNTTVDSKIKTLTINGNGKTINGQNMYQFLTCRNDVRINNLNIISCSGDYGVAIINYGKLSITNSRINNNNAERGGVIINLGTLIITNSTLNNNNGSIYNRDNLTITNCTLNNNNNYHGGAIQNDGELIVTNSILNNNIATLHGGAINNEAGNVTVTNCTLTGNRASTGGAIYNYFLNGNYGKILIINSTLNNNHGHDGGAVYNGGDGNLTITKCRLNNNNANQSGGAIDNSAYLTITNTTLNNNNVKEHGGAIDNWHGYLTITNTTLNNNSATEYGGAINNWNANLTIYNGTLNNNKVTGKEYNYGSGTISNICGNVTITNCTLNNNNVSNYGGALYNIDGSNLTITNSTLNNNNATNGGALYNNNANMIVKSNKFFNNNATIGPAISSYRNHNLGPYKTEYNTKVIIEENTFRKNKANSTGKAIMVSGATSFKNNNFDDGKKAVKIILSPIKGIICENITLKAMIIDENGKKVNDGNLAFKLNGKTLRKDGRFDSTASAMKFSIKNGTVSYTLKADLYLRNAKYIEASYSGTSIYTEMTSSSVTAQIQKRYAQLTVTTTPTRAKQYETITFTIKAKDTTKNGKNNTLISTNTKVMLKINGVTLKDKNGKTLYLALDKNAQATYKYIIPAGTGGITNNKQARNYTVTAIFVGDNYYTNARNTTNFQVERSNTTVTITQVKVTNNTYLTLKATLKDYKGNNLIGKNHLTIKINGKSFTVNGEVPYWTVNNGIVDLDWLIMDPKITIKRIMLVTGERQAYTEGRAETTNILKA